MTFKQRIWLLPIMVAGIVSIGIAVNAQITSSAANALKRIGEVQYPLVEALRLLRSDHTAVQDQLQQAVSEGEAASIDKTADRISGIHNTLSQVKRLGGDEQILAEKLLGKFDAYLSSATQASRLMLAATGDSSVAIKTMQQDNAALEALLAESNEKAIGDFKTLLADSRSSVRNTLIVSVVSALVTMVVLGIGSWILIGSVFQSLGGEPETAVQVVRRIATGDFTQEVQLRHGDSNSLLYDIVSLQEKLGTLIRDIHHSSSDVDNAAHEMNSAVTQLSDRTSAQAASLEETASSMEEMTATVKQNADNARQANDLAVATRKQAEAGGDIVNKAIGAMAEINASSKRIADIISVIDEIAFQTNLLALNAAVEAARAGEQGRGFAVVATEVRNLAQRSATAAREIKNLINESVIKVQDGSELVNTSGGRLNEIVTSVKRVADIIGDISAASQEQARGLEQVNSTVTQLDQVTQQNSAMVRQASTVSDNVALQARRLLEIVSQFKIEEGDQAQSAPHASPALMSGNAASAADWQQVA